MNLQEISKKAEELAKKYNPQGLAPFPYENIVSAHKNLDIVFSDDLEVDVSGAILYKDDLFTILINSSKPEVRQHFTIGHELGHFFLHQKHIKDQKGLIDGERNLDGQKILYRRDDNVDEEVEIEANNFAASLIMPEQLVREVWGVSSGIEDAAKLFHVSVVAMSVRLERLGLVV